MLALELQQSHFAADRTPIQIARSNIFSSGIMYKQVDYFYH